MKNNELYLQCCTIDFYQKRLLVMNRKRFPYHACFCWCAKANNIAVKEERVFRNCFLKDTEWSKFLLIFHIMKACFAHFKLSYLSSCCSWKIHRNGAWSHKWTPSYLFSIIIICCAKKHFRFTQQTLIAIRTGPFKKSKIA